MSYLERIRLREFAKESANDVPNDGVKQQFVSHDQGHTLVVGCVQ